MKKILVSIMLILCLVFSGCSVYEKEITKIYSVEQYKIHDAGIEVWARLESGTEKGFFMQDDNIYSCEESSRVIVIYSKYNYCSYDCPGHSKNAYLYLQEDEYKEYIKEKYDL